MYKLEGINMMRLVLIVLLAVIGFESNGQACLVVADSIRREFKIPELGYAVVSADSILEMRVVGEEKVGSGRVAILTDRFRIGSNTKAITGFIAAQMVKIGLLKWDTKFFDLFPEMKAGSRKDYHNITLLQALSFRTKLPKYTYTNAVPVKSQFYGNEEEQRMQFAKWMFSQPTQHTKDTMGYTNLGYLVAELMMEKASGKSYKELVKELNGLLGTNFGFGRPSTGDTLQTYGHDSLLRPEDGKYDYKLEWLLAAGNINATLPDYVKFIQEQLKGLQGKSKLFTKEEYNFLHFGLPVFSIGWFCDKDDDGHIFSHNTGNPGTFLTSVYVYRDIDRAYILLSNVQSASAEKGLDCLFDLLFDRYQK